MNLSTSRKLKELNTNKRLREGYYFYPGNSSKTINLSLTIMTTITYTMNGIEYTERTTQNIYVIGVDDPDGTDTVIP